MKHGVVVAAVAVAALSFGTAFGQQQPAGQSAQSSVQIPSDTLQGSKVRDQQGKEIGEVSQVMIDPEQGTVTSVIITSGGTLGVGGKELSVPWNAVDVKRDRDQLVLTLRQQVLDEIQRGQQGSQPAASPPSGQPGHPGQPQTPGQPPRQ
jgi:sporulation protein YlmC with PRC-barrel domain